MKTAFIIIILGAKVSGLLKLDVTPAGGARAGMLARKSIPRRMCHFVVKDMYLFT